MDQSLNEARIGSDTDLATGNRIAWGAVLAAILLLLAARAGTVLGLIADADAEALLSVVRLLRFPAAIALGFILKGKVLLITASGGVS